MDCYACIHCHFYQPPRENPWLEAVESQDSASPHHDWNERIAKECYLPNGASRILDSRQRISKIVNNYNRISFNFGPTLLSWMEQCAPDAYQKILDGDRQSRRLFSGHGSALAQAYNHTILPLSNSRDKRTQIIWGIKDFEHRFRREPEGMWLPETAVDVETLEILSAEGIRFTILAPRQAAQLRKGKRSSWIDLEYGIDSRRAYVCPLPSGRVIGLFFYDGVISNAVAFEKLLFSGENFARRLLSRFDPDGDFGQLMHVATDGETYGHHHIHGDMALAYALDCIEEQKLARLTNYGEYFALHPPAEEVRIKERSSWSCIHGVARWKHGCGCNSGAHPHWNQNWRQPLREAFDWLRDSLRPAYVDGAKELLIDPWSARDEYITAVLDRSPAAVECFLAKHRRHLLSPDEEVHTLRLLEMQRHLMLMYTSCGWFFDEATGPETVQVLEYAGRAVQLGQQLFGGDREEQFLKRLEPVSSNIPGFGNGREIFERFVRPAMLDLPGVAAHFAISSFFEGFRHSQLIYAYKAHLREVQTFACGKLRLTSGTARITSRITHARLEFNFAVVHSGGHNLCAGISQMHPEFQGFMEQVRLGLSQQDFAACCQLFAHYFGKDVYSLKSLFHDERRRIINQIVDSTLADIEKLYGEVYEDNTALIGFLRELSMPLPAILRVSSEFVLNNELRRSLSGEDIDLGRVRLLLETAQQQGVVLDARVKAACRERVGRVLERWARSPFDLTALQQLEAMVSLMQVPLFETDLWKPQNTFYDVMVRISLLNASHISAKWLDHFRCLGERLGVALLEPPPVVVECAEKGSPLKCASQPPRPLLLDSAERVCPAGD